MSKTEDELEYHVYGPGEKNQVLAEINKDYELGIIRTVMGCAMAYVNGDAKFGIMVKRNPKLVSNNFSMHDSRDV
jgi:hypothetical protein